MQALSTNQTKFSNEKTKHSISKLYNDSLKILKPEYYNIKKYLSDCLYHHGMGYKKTPLLISILLYYASKGNLEFLNIS